MNLLAQVENPIWQSDFGSAAGYLKVGFGLLLGGLLIFALLQAPTQFRRPIVVGVTFLSGLFFVLSFVIPQNINMEPGDKPRNLVESTAKFLNDSTGIVVSFGQVLAGFMLGLGIFSLLRIHVMRIAKRHPDRFFSVVLLVSLFTMAIIACWHKSQELARGAALDDFSNWSVINKLQDLLFEGLLQQMDAIMFSLIAFFILSAAYRAFRIRSIEATILLSVALLMILSLMGLVTNLWDGAVNRAFESTPVLRDNLTLTSITTFLKKKFQTPAVNAIGFGTGLGALSMGIRIWLGLERGGKK